MFLVKATFKKNGYRDTKVEITGTLEEAYKIADAMEELYPDREITIKEQK